MAVSANSLWMLALCACFTLSLGADCGKDCALCAYRLLDTGSISLLGQQSCSIECDGNLDATKIRLCRDVLLEVERDPVELIKQRLGEEVEGKQLNLAKRYGGFMKRYGGFMIRRNLPTQGGALDGEDTPVAEEDDIRLEILKILNAEAEGLRDGKRDEVKRYGGFIRSEEDLGARHGPGRPLKKRYGGFMRRVGRPEWGETQNIQQGALKRRWEAGESPLGQLQKRYGGFMD